MTTKTDRVAAVPAELARHRRTRTVTAQQLSEGYQSKSGRREYHVICRLGTGEYLVVEPTVQEGQ